MIFLASSIVSIYGFVHLSAFARAMAENFSVTCESLHGLWKCELSAYVWAMAVLPVRYDFYPAGANMYLFTCQSLHGLWQYEVSVCACVGSGSCMHVLATTLGTCQSVLVQIIVVVAIITSVLFSQLHCTMGSHSPEAKRRKRKAQKKKRRAVKCKKSTGLPSNGLSYQDGSSSVTSEVSELSESADPPYEPESDSLVCQDDVEEDLIAVLDRVAERSERF